MPAIEINHLTKKYGDHTAVYDLCLNIEEGELFSLLGVNGAGKTTTIKMLSCLLRPTNGDALLHGISIAANPYAVKEIINISPQETAVAPNLTVMENIMLIARIYGSEKKRAHDKAKEMAFALGLEEVMNSRAKALSGGMQRRLSIALALISEPKVLFLDEPTLGLDVLARRELWSIIKKLKERVTIILTTHYMEEAEALSDRIGIMEKGKLKAAGTAEQLLSITGAETFENAFIAIVSQGGGI